MCNKSPKANKLRARWSINERKVGVAGEATAIFTSKFDAKGNVKIVKMRRLSAKELEEEQ